MNKVILIGRLTRDPDIRYSSGEKPVAVARFTLAVNRRYKREGNEQQADFISCVSFGKPAEFIERYFHQGTKIAIEGRIQTGSYTNRDGIKIYTTDVVVENVEFAESKGVAGSNVEDCAAAGNYKSSGTEEVVVTEDGFMNIPDNIDDDGLPFN